MADLPRGDEPAEKCIRTLPSIRISDTLDAALRVMAGREERDLSDFVRRLLDKHCFGHAASLADEIKVAKFVRDMKRDA